MTRKLTDDQIVQARKMRDEDMTNQAIGDALGVSHQTIRCAVNPQAREHHRLSCARYHKNHKKEHRLYAEKWQKDHKEEIRSRKTVYRKDHLSERALYRATRKALILGATIGNLTEIKEIYRRTKEDAKVRCYLCGKLIPKGHRHVDHIIPLSRGGAHRPSNLAAACDRCNLRKNAKVPEELGLLL